MRAKTKIKYVFFLLGLLRSVLAFAQADAIQTLQRQFEQFGTQGLREKLYVHTDKNFYTPGEVIWFKVYAVDGIFNKPLDLSKAAYIEILDKDHKQVLSGKVPMRNGSGFGSFTIPASINSGNYLFRAYTNWMRNDGPGFFFEKMLTIVNSLKKPGWTAQKAGENYDIQFLPEGGQLVSGIESRVAFKAIDENGKGMDCKGFILDKKNDTLSYFQTLRSGMGRFSFLPSPGNEYRAFIRLQDGAIEQIPFPEVRATGFVLQCEDHEKTLMITVITNEESSNIYLLVHTRQVIKNITAANITNGKAEFTINKDLLGDGVSDMVIFNDQLKPVCERLYFKRPKQQLQIALKTDKAEYAKRDRVDLQLQTTNQRNAKTDADLSLSVYLLDSVQTYGDNDIMSYLWLSSELRGHIDNPAYYFNSTEPEAAEAADNLMMTQGWRRFNWSDVQQNKRPLREFIPETDGSFARGRIVDKQSGLPAAGVQAYLSVPGQHYFFTSTLSDSEGRVNFNINDLYGNNDVVVQPAGRDSNRYRIDINKPFSNEYSSTALPHLSMPVQFTPQLQMHSLSGQVQVAYMGKEQQRYIMTSFSDSTAFFGKPDGKYFLEDYTRFKTMEEVIREYVTEVRLRKKDGVFRYMVKNTPYQSFFDLDPLILLDGVPVLKQDEMALFDPLKIKKVEVVARTFYTGPVAHYGIVSYSTYDGDLAGFQLPSNAIVTDYPGFLYERSFYAPTYETEQEISSRMPDFRNVLEWDPKVRTKEGEQSINFYTSDLPGKYLIVVEGISKDGTCGSATQMISVKK
ncbi:MAG TPA: hypothetical protein VGQ53_20190 [Chitinophagaceae bacterium]|nr:hypothetical protein [Chitinophagaceae bacterium]